MKIAVEGCAHGELDTIYEALELLEKRNNFKVDLLLCCGDFQAVRNEFDLNSMAVPPKYRRLCSFYKYYSGEKKAPILTIFIGGNHEASSYLQELPYGGWVAPNIYYLGYAGIVNVAGIRIAGLSGIYKGQEYMMGHYERPPYYGNTKQTVYKVRNVEVFRMKQIKTPIDIFMSHDWPRGIHKYGNYEKLLKLKPYFKDDIDQNKLGSPLNEELLFYLKPKYWFSAHLHCKFSALVRHNDEKNNITKFLALDKCLPRRKYLQIFDLEHDKTKPLEIHYDLEWLCVLHFTNHLQSINKEFVTLPNAHFKDDIRWDFTPKDIEKDFILEKLAADLKVPNNFSMTGSPYKEGQMYEEFVSVNPQTQEFCRRIGVTDIFESILKLNPPPTKSPLVKSPLPQLNESNFSSFVDSEELNNSSENSPSETSESATSTPTRLPLSLPPPKFSSEADPVDSPTQTEQNKESSKEVFFIDIDGTDSVPDTKVKKFKRRNQDIYNSSVDD